MLKRLLHWRIRAFERQYDYDAAYLHELADADPRGLMAFQRFTGAGAHDGGLPRDLLHGARVAAARFEDCGPCVQLVVDMALEAGVDEAVLGPLLAGRPEDAGGDASLGYRFATAVLAAAPGLDDLRRELVACHGPGAPWILGLAVSVGRTFPVIKRAMGHARACSVVTIGGTRVAPAAR